MNPRRRAPAEPTPSLSRTLSVLNATPLRDEIIPPHPAGSVLPGLTLPLFRMKILHLEDNATDAELVLDWLREEWPDCETHVAATQPECLAALQRQPFDLILSDYSLISFSGHDGLRLARQYQPDTPFIFFSGTIREETAIEAMRDGAWDYVLKDRPQRLITAIQLAMQKRADRDKQRRAEARIREQCELLDRARDAIIVTDGNNRVVTWNQGATRLLGWTADEVLGQPGVNLLGPDAFVPPIGANEDEWQREISTTAKSGTPLMLDTHVTVLRDEAGKPKARICISTDITEKHQLQEQFFRAQRLESLGMLASGIAHDLNNILAPILMAPPMLRERAHDPADVALLNVLETSAQRGSDLVRQIVGFANGTAGQHQSLQVRHVIRDIVNLLRHSMPRNIELDHHLPNDLWPTAGSPSQIHQVLLNLCINARDAMPKGGKLSLRASNVTLGESDPIPAGGRPGSWLLLEVEDTGTGIPGDVLQKIWEPFFTTKPPGKGTGLGLSTVRGIVESHRGFIDVKTSVAHGTTFRIYLPKDTSGE